MTEIEFFVNAQNSSSDRNLPPLEMVSEADPVSCFWAAFNGAALGVVTNYAIEKVLAHYIANKNNGGYLNDGVVAAPASPVLPGMSGEQLIGLARAVQS